MKVEETVKPGLALSTSWHARRSESVEVMAEETAAMGFSRIELSYVPPALLPGMGEAMRSVGVEVASIHNPLPVPVNGEGVPQAPSSAEWLAALDRKSWQAAVDAARRTIELAAELGGPGAVGVVVHFGKVDVASRQRALMELRRERGPDDPEFLSLRKEAWIEREHVAPHHLELAVEAAVKLGEAAKAAGVWIGAETRDGYHEIPCAEEFELLLGATKGLPVGYWHDVGHAAKQEFLGYQSPGQLLERWGPTMVGIHLHDSVSGRDHLAPGEGEVDYAKVAEVIPDGALRTLELGPAVTMDGVRQGRAVLARFGLGE